MNVFMGFPWYRQAQGGTNEEGLVRFLRTDGVIQVMLLWRSVYAPQILKFEY